MSDGSEQLPLLKSAQHQPPAEQSSPQQPSDILSLLVQPPQLCLPLPIPPAPISPHRRGTLPGDHIYNKLVPKGRKTAKGFDYYIPGTCRSKSAAVRSRAARIKPLPKTPAAQELKDLMAKVNLALIHGMKEKHGVIWARPKSAPGRKPFHFPGLPMKELAALVKLKLESLTRTLLGKMMASTRTLMVLSDISGLRMETFARLWELRQLVDKDVQEVWERRSLLIKEGLKNRARHWNQRGQPGWLASPQKNPALRDKVD